LDRKPEFDRSDLYRNYSAFKGWGSEPVVDDMDRFSRTIDKLRLTAETSILEVGFGEGRFLDWARRRGYKVEGVEILPELVDYARMRGHTVHLGTVQQSIESSPRFDLIAAFDVIEHLTAPEIIDLLRSADLLLKPNGKILLQFPNASSPFSALYQRGDLTHQSNLSVASLEQISRPRGWKVAQSFNARPTSRHPLKCVKLWLAHSMRTFLEMIFSFAYYYGRNHPLDPIIIVVLERVDAGSRPSSLTA
jgi:SAM-dependent methyltransferase